MFPAVLLMRWAIFHDFTLFGVDDRTMELFGGIILVAISAPFGFAYKKVTSPSLSKSLYVTFVILFCLGGLCSLAALRY